MPERETTPESAHDVLAAEAFAVPAPDPELHHHGPVTLPEDPAGIAEPHDVLAAEEFPMPAARAHPAAALVERRGGLGRLVLEVAVAFALVAVGLRLLKRR